MQFGNDVIISGADFVPVCPNPFIPAVHAPEIVLVPIEA